MIVSVNSPPSTYRQVQIRVTGSGSAFQPAVPTEGDRSAGWPAWAERALGRRITARNLRALLDELASQQTFGAARDGAVVVLALAAMELSEASMRLDAGPRRGELLANFVNTVQVLTNEAISHAAQVATWAAAALKLGSDVQVREFALTMIERLVSFLERLPGLVRRLTEYAIAAGVQIAELSSKDLSLWAQLLAQMRELVPDAPRVPMPLGPIAAGLAAIVGLVVVSWLLR